MTENNILILVVTYKCNLDCSYCKTIKNINSMSWEIAKKSIDLFLRLEKPSTIKFFGSEPLLEINLVKKIIDYVRDKNKDVKLLLTTNGINLDESIINFFRKRKVELTISIDGNLETHLKNRKGNLSKSIYKNMIKNKEKLSDSIINMVIAPNTVNQCYNNFLYLYNLGFRKFNFLPATFLVWDEKDLKMLSKNLLKIAEFKIYKDSSLFIKNCEIFNKTFFFNDGIVIDYNGDIYQNNLILIGDLKPLKSKLKVGNVRNLSSFEEMKFYDRDFNKLVNSMIDEKIIKSHTKVDEILDQLVESSKT